jgi:hypothetical protein
MSDSGEKVDEKVEVTQSQASSDKPVSADVDAAWKFLDGHRDAAVTETDLTALRHKIDWHIVPIMFLCYTMQFLDKVIYNVSLPSFKRPLPLLCR